MRVLHVLYSTIYTGAEKVAAQIIRSFDGEVDMAYCSLEDATVRKIVEDQGIPFLSFPELTPRNLKKILREYQPDVIHAHDMRTSFVASLCCGSIPLVSHIHNNAYDSRGLSVKSIAYLVAGFKAKHILWVSPSAYEGYVFHKLFAQKSQVLYNIIDTRQIYSMRDADTASYGYDLLYLGRLSYEKDPLRVIRVCDLLRKSRPQVQLAIVGSGDLQEEAEALVHQLGLEENVHFLGFQSNPMKILADSTAMVLTSRWEGTPMCALEAMALGTPVVSTPTDGMKDLIRSGENGYLSDDDGELAADIEKILSDPAHHRALSHQAKADFEVFNDQDAYKKAIGKCYGAEYAR